MKTIISTLAALLLAHTGAVFAATITWSGLGNTDTWAEGANWVGGVPPTTGDRAVFPSGAARIFSVNNIPSTLDGVEVRSARTFAGDFTLGGANPLRIENGNVTFEGLVRLTHPNPIVTGISSGGGESVLLLAPTGQLQLPGVSTLRLDAPAAGRFDLQGSISGSDAALALAGNQIVLGGANTIGAVGSNAQSVLVTNSAALGSTVPGTAVNAGTLTLGLASAPPLDIVESFDLRRAEGGTALRIAGDGSAPVRLFGPISISGTQVIEAQTPVQIIGAITGFGRLQITQGASGIVELDNNSNNFTGPLDVLGGKVRPLRSEVIPDAVDVVIGSNGTFSMIATTETVHGVDCRGRLELAHGGLLRVLARTSFVDCNLAYVFPGTASATADITLIRNDSGEAFVGEARNAPEGTVFTIRGVAMSLTYRGGANGRDLVLKMPPPPPPPPPPPTYTREVQGASPDGGYILLSATSLQSSCNFAQAQFVDQRSILIPADRQPPPNLTFPHGLVSFRVENCGAGQEVEFALEFPQALPPTATIWKFGPTPDNANPRWYPFPSRVEGNRIEFTVRDGGVGDDDVNANGQIADAMGVAIANGLYQDLWWAGSQENGWGISIAHHRDILFANFFVYDAQGRPVWYVMPSGTRAGSNTRFSGALYFPRGTPYYSYDASRHDVGSPVGSATITFSGANNALLEYTINGVSASKAISRIFYGPHDTVARESVADLWWGGPSQNGWGIPILQQSSTLFSLWFTYDANGAPTWFAMPGGQWTSATDYEGRVYRAVGPPWLGVQYDVSRHQTIDVGSYRVHFEGGTATFTYSVEGRTGSMPISRVPF